MKPTAAAQRRYSAFYANYSNEAVKAAHDYIVSLKDKFGSDFNKLAAAAKRFPDLFEGAAQDFRKAKRSNDPADIQTAMEMAALDLNIAELTTRYEYLMLGPDCPSLKSFVGRFVEKMRK